jgi:cytochrome c oxidase cbb3-type subunit 4
MYKQFFAALDSTALPLAAMAFFVLAFVVVVVRTFSLKRTNDYDAVAQLPLDDSADSASNSEPRPARAPRGDA